MKKIYLALISLLLMVFLIACDDTSNNETDSVNNNFFNDTLTLQGTLFDATTGARLTGTSLNVYMIRGGNTIYPSVLRRGTTETTFAGDYAFAGVPVTVNGNATYRVVAVLDGYQQFEAYISPTSAAVANNNTLDTEYNMIGNIYMFPLGSVASDVNVYVEYNGERVEGATVQLQQIIASTGGAGVQNVPTALTTTRLANSVNGLLPALTATTSSTGVANFASALLTLGGQYKVVVLPMAYEGTQLALDTGAANIIIGTSVNESYVSMEDTAPGTEDNGLYIVSASNRDTEDVLASGVLTITFNKAIALVSEDTFAGVLTNATTAVLTVADTVAATVSTDGLVLTLTPSFSTAVVPYNGSNIGTADIDTYITYTGGGITLAGDNTGETMTILSGADTVDYLDGTDISRVVRITGTLTD